MGSPVGPPPAVMTIPTMIRMTKHPTLMTAEMTSASPKKRTGSSCRAEIGKSRRIEGEPERSEKEAYVDEENQRQTDGDYDCWRYICPVADDDAGGRNLRRNGDRVYGIRQVRKRKDWKRQGKRTAVSVADGEGESESGVDETGSPVRERAGGRDLMGIEGKERVE